MMIIDKIKKLFNIKQSDSKEGSYQDYTLSKNLQKNMDSLKDIFKDCEDFKNKPLKIGGNIDAQIIFIEGMIDVKVVDDFLIKPLIYSDPANKINSGKDAYNYAKDAILSSSNIMDIDNLEKVIKDVLSGFTIILIDNNKTVLSLDNKGWEHRNVEMPSVEVSMKGPKDAFTETFTTNVMLVRRRIRDPRLKLKKLCIGRRSKTEVGVMYIEDIIDGKLVKEVLSRLNRIDIDNVQSNSIIEQMIEDSWISPFPQVSNTERPDKIASSLLEGKICIITDNSPYVTILPITLNSLMQAPDDYYERWGVVFILRFVRMIGTFVSLILPSLYIAMLSYNPEMIPTRLALSLAPGREYVPFPAFIEAFLMEGVFELMREAGIRLPGSLGQTIGVVGAVVIGQAAVTANVVSPAMVVIVALTGIANFVIPGYGLAISFRMLRFFLMLLATIFGLYGIILGVLLILSHMCTLKSFGVPYLSPWAPLSLTDLKDSVFRAPWKFLKERPEYMNTEDKVRINKKKTNRIKKKGYTK